MPMWPNGLIWALFIKILPEQREIGDWMGKEVGYVQPKFKWK